MKQCLVSDPILKPLNPNKDLVLSTDGSVYGLGFYALQQDDMDGMLHAVKYSAFSTTPHQANYSADDLELTALMPALKSVQQLALLRHVTVITDNSHVLHVNDWKASNATQKRMIAYIMQFNMSLIYIRGSRNLFADALSRLFQDTTIQERVEHQAKYMHSADDFVLPVTTRSVSRATLNTTTLQTAETQRTPSGTIAQSPSLDVPQRHTASESDIVFNERQSRFARLWLDMIIAQSDAHNFDADRSMLNSNADTETATQLTTPDA